MRKNWEILRILLYLQVISTLVAATFYGVISRDNKKKFNRF